MKGYILLVSLCLLALLSGAAAKKDPEIALKSELCSQCSKCDKKECPPSESYPHMTAWGDSLIFGASQSDYVAANDRGVYSVPNIKGGQSSKYSSYYRWKSTSGSASGYHRFSNYMDKCSGGQLTNWEK